MKKKIFISPLIILCTLFGINSRLYSQKDTLHIYYKGLQTEIADSNDAKITKWVKSLKGQHVDIEIYGYYESADYKKFMAERVENLFMVVNRKARDFITVKFMGPVKGKKWQRSMADVVYISSDAAAQQPQATPEDKKKKGKESAEPTNTQVTDKTAKDTKTNDKKTEGKKSDSKAASIDKDDKYRYDTTYVNGVMKVKKIKKQ